MATPTDYNHLRLDLSPEQISQHTKEITEKAKNIYDDIATLKPEECTFESVILPMARLDSWFGVETNNVTLTLIYDIANNTARGN